MTANDTDRPTTYTDRPTTPVDVAGPSQDVAGPTASTPEKPIVAKEQAPCADERTDDTITPPHGDKLGEKV